MLEQDILAVYKFGVVRLVNRKILTVEFYLAEVINVVLTFYDEVNLYPLLVVIPFLNPR